MNSSIHTSSPRKTCLRRLTTPRQVKARVICFTWCGAGASVYRRFAPLLASHIELIAVQLPGREERFSDPKFTRMDAILRHVLPELLALNDAPLCLFGHSMGAIVAYEMALALQMQTRPCTALIVSGHASPEQRDHSHQTWHLANEDEFIANIARLGGTPPDVLADRSIMRLFLPSLRADYEVLETYTRTRSLQLDCPLIACAGKQDPEVSIESLAAWSNLSDAPFHSHWFEGDHFYLNSDPQSFALKLGTWIDDALQANKATPERAQNVA